MVYLTVVADRAGSFVINFIKFNLRGEGTCCFTLSFEKKVINVDDHILGVLALVRIEFSGGFAEGKIILSLVILCLLAVQLHLILLLMVCGHYLQSLEIALLGMRISWCPPLGSGSFV